MSEESNCFIGHEIIATVAQMHLHPSVMPILCDILNYKGNCHLAPVAAWADRIRGLPQYRWTGPLHYIGATDDYPSETCAFPGERGWEGRRNINVLSGIRNTTNTLESYMGLRKAGLTTENDEDAAQVALKFLIHFVGDMHMPLHLTGRDRGGNGIKVSFDSRVTSQLFPLLSFLVLIICDRPSLPVGRPPHSQKNSHNTLQLYSPSATSRRRESASGHHLRPLYPSCCLGRHHGQVRGRARLVAYVSRRTLGPTPANSLGTMAILDFWASHRVLDCGVSSYRWGFEHR